MTQENKWNIINIAMGIMFENKFIVNNLLELIQVNYQHCDGYKYKKSTEVPFFGIKNIIIGKQGVSEAFGIRSGIRGFGNAICLDFQNDFKNIHLKISSDIFHITGCKKYEMGINVGENIIKIIEELDEDWIPFFNLSIDEKEDICNKALQILIENDNLLMYDDPIVLNRFNHIEIKYRKYALIIRNLLLFSYDYPNIESFTNKINKIIRLQTGQNSVFFKGKDIKIIDNHIYNGVYRCKINYEFFLPELALFFDNLNFLPQYHNFDKGHQLCITIPVDEIYVSQKIVKHKVIPVHKFIIHMNGTIQQSSPTSVEQAYNSFLIIYNHLIEFIKENKENEKKI